MSIAMTRHDDGTVTVDEAPPTAYVALSALLDLDPAVVAFVGGLMVIADQVAYRPRAFDRNGNLICDREEWKP